MAEKGYNNLPKLIAALPGIIEKAVESEGVYYAGKVVDRIDQQDPSWEPKKDSTIRGYIRRRQRAVNIRAAKGLIRRAYKVKQTRKEKLWVDTGDLRTEIHQQRNNKATHEGEQYHVRVGVFSEDRVMAAASLEFGQSTRDISARPLFGPVADEERDKMQDLAEKIIRQELRTFLR